MLTNGFKINECDKCIYVNDTENGYVIFYLYVDDMLIVGNDDEIIKYTKDILPPAMCSFLPERRL